MRHPLHLEEELEHHLRLVVAFEHQLAAVYVDEDARLDAFGDEN